MGIELLLNASPSPSSALQRPHGCAERTRGEAKRTPSVLSREAGGGQDTRPLAERADSLTHVFSGWGWWCGAQGATALHLAAQGGHTAAVQVRQASRYNSHFTVHVRPVMHAHARRRRADAAV